jgi:hypothetical protein
MDRSDEYVRWQFLYDNPALTRRGWLPPGEDVPKLVDLRNEHDRLLDACDAAAADAAGLARQRAAEEEARRAAQEAEFLGTPPFDELPTITVTDEELLDARVRAQAAKDAMQTFARSAIAEIKQREPEFKAGFEKVFGEAAVKRAEAEALLAEADRLELSTRRLNNWLARIDGRSHLGHIAWDDLTAPVPLESRSLAEIAEAANPQMVEVLPPDEDAIEELDPNYPAYSRGR